MIGDEGGGISPSAGSDRLDEGEKGVAFHDPLGGDQPTPDRAAVLRRFAAWPKQLQLGFITAALHVYTAGENQPGALRMFTGILAQIDEREACRKRRTADAA